MLFVSRAFSMTVIVILPSRFNLGIEMLFVSSAENDGTKLATFWKFQSRNRDAFRFKILAHVQKLSSS